MNFENFDTAGLDTLAKFARIMKKEGADFTALMQNTNKRRDLVAYVNAGCPRIHYDNESGERSTTIGIENLGRAILGDSLITPDDIEANTDIRYTDAQKAQAIETMPVDIKTLQAIKDDGMVMIFGPPDDMGIGDVYHIGKYMFGERYNKEASLDHFEERLEAPILNKANAGKWLIISKKAIGESYEQRYDEQIKLIKPNERVPNMAELLYAAVMYEKVRERSFFADTLKDIGSHKFRTSTIIIKGMNSIYGIEKNRVYVSCLYCKYNGRILGWGSKSDSSTVTSYFSLWRAWKLESML